MEIRERGEALRLGFVVGPGQAPDRLLDHFPGKSFGKVKLVRPQRASKVKLGLDVGDAHQVAALAAKVRHEIVEVEVPLAGRRFGFDGGQAARKASVLGLVRSLINVEGFDRGDGHVNRKAPRDGIDRFRRIHQQDALGLHLALDSDSAVRSPHDAGDQWQRGLEFLLGQRQGEQLLGSQRCGRSGALLGDGGRGRPHLDRLPQDGFSR